MGNRSFGWILLTGALALVLTANLAAAQSESDPPAEERQTTAKTEAETEEGADTVYTTDYLEKRFAEKKEGASPTVFTNESLDEAADEPAEAAPGTFTNEDLRERFGTGEEPEAATGEEAPEVEAEADEDEETREPEPETVSGEPSLSAAERARRIADIDDELERLEQRLVAVRNPLLAGTAPPTEEERADEAGLDNTERLRQIEAKIDELRATLAKLRAQDGASPER
jgi:hypothetical protein